MPRPKLPPRLYLRTGKTGSRYWIIRDGTTDQGTGCAEHEAGEAEQALARYLADKHDAPRRKRSIDDIPVADVLMIYADDKLPTLATFQKAKGRIRRLGEWWA